MPTGPALVDHAGEFSEPASRKAGKPRRVGTGEPLTRRTERQWEMHQRGHPLAGRVTVPLPAPRLAPNIQMLVADRALQGVGGALLTPGSLAILHASFRAADRGRAIGAWSGLTGIAGATGPFVGGWLIGVSSWRWIFLINVPIALLVVVVASRRVPESRDPAASHHTDVMGAGLAATGLAALTYGLIAWPTEGLGAPSV